VQNKPSATSSPAYVTTWINNAEGKLKRNLEFGQQQAGTGVGRGQEPTTPNTSGIKIIKREKIQ